MTNLALVHGSGLLGKELRRYLDQRRDQWRDLRLLTTIDEEVGTLTEVRGAAAMVQQLEDDSLDAVDVVLLVGDTAQSQPVLDRLPAGTTAILLGADLGSTIGEPIVASVNLDTVHPGGRWVSPHPATVGIATLLAPLQTYQPIQLVATVLQSASAVSAEAIDEVLKQSRSILTFQSDPTLEVFGAQIAYNLLPARSLDGVIGAQLHHVLDSELSVAVQTVQAGIFHGLALSLYVRFLDDPGVGAVRGMLDDQPSITVAEDPDTLGPIVAADSDAVVVGDIQPADHEGGYWVWAVLDNLTFGGAGNAMQILQALSEQVTN